MKTKTEEYFTFLGVRYNGNWETAYNLYSLSKEYPTFSDYLLYEGKPIQTTFSEFIDETEKEFLTAQLKQNGYNISKTANELKILRVTLCTKIVKLGIELPGRQLNFKPYTKKIKL